jgi:hypothetical protein
LRFTPVSGFTESMPAFFVWDLGCLTEPEDAGVVGADVVEGEEVGVGLAELGRLTGVAVAGGMSAMLDCRACASSPERLGALIVTKSVATSRGRDRFFALRFIDLLFTEMRTHGTRGSLEFRHDGEDSG